MFLLRKSLFMGFMLLRLDQPVNPRFISYSHAKRRTLEEDICAMKKRDRIGRLDIRNFLRNTLKRKILNDLSRHRIANEADPQSFSGL